MPSSQEEFEILKIPQQEELGQEVVVVDYPQTDP